MLVSEQLAVIACPAGSLNKGAIPSEQATDILNALVVIDVFVQLTKLLPGGLDTVVPLGHVIVLMGVFDPDGQVDVTVVPAILICTVPVGVHAVETVGADRVETEIDE